MLKTAGFSSRQVLHRDRQRADRMDPEEPAGKWTAALNFTNQPHLDVCWAKPWQEAGQFCVSQNRRAKPK